MGRMVRRSHEPIVSKTVAVADCRKRETPRIAQENPAFATSCRIAGGVID